MVGSLSCNCFWGTCMATNEHKTVTAAKHIDTVLKACDVVVVEWREAERGRILEFSLQQCVNSVCICHTSKDIW